MGSIYFKSYERHLSRILMAELVEQTMTECTPRRLSLSVPCIHAHAWRAPSDRSFSDHATAQAIIATG
jgi:hypothetical protein